ncbi:hypothetical protein [Chryseobacterium rhizosphaerae]|uniref:Uncharacterized protein n=1 Tax=Chryseobacterium rhizosphaerae TaxID=395937 RepID=A0ABX9IGZ8_9FLAO|nr:hypothetical protein [Chryseobacterium rhizosphaerae]REC73107.1 hypothetical protein DRF57_18120 [Chryseobacterium rhizosphaerae]GEN67719.1 hypothetical protein CRH01_22870 [Chryseobacterium rhizosphaerae]
MKIIDDKSKIAVEYLKTKEKGYGYARIFIENKIVGSKEDLIPYVSYLSSGLNQIINSETISKCVFETFNSFNLKNIYYYLKANLDSENMNTYKYHISFGTFTDDYLIFSFKYEDKIYIVWKVVNRNTIFSDIANLKKNINIFSERYDIMENAIQNILERVSK